MEISLIYMRIVFCTFDGFYIERFHTTLLPPCTKTIKLPVMLLGSKPFLWEMNLFLV